MRILYTALAAIALSGAGCESEVAPPAPVTASPQAAEPATPGLSNCCSKEEAAGTIPGTSVYQLESTWQDQSGANRTLASFRGRPVVMAMVFTTCEYACPRIMADLKAIEAELGERRDETRFVLISFDTERDLPPVLADYASTQELDLRRWTLLHGAGRDVRELAAVLGIKYKKSETIGFSHSNSISLLDNDGEIAYQLQGLGADPKELLAQLRSPDE